MWQRVQTLYLAIATALVVVLFFSIKAFTVGPDGSHVEEYRYVDYFPYLVLLIVGAVLQVLALTTPKIRVFQMRTAVLAAMVLLGLQGWLAVDFIQAHGAMVFRYTAIFPLVACILDFMAARNILSDELLVQSADHLRGSRGRKR